MKNFKSAPVDLLTTLTSYGVTVLLMISLFLIDDDAWKFSLAVLYILTVLFGLAHRPSFELSDRYLYIKNRFRMFAIPLDQIAGIAPQQPFIFTFRWFGIGGFFGYYGQFNIREKWWVTNRNCMVKLQLRNGYCYMVSPELPTAFIDAVKEKLITSPAQA